MSFFINLYHRLFKKPKKPGEQIQRRIRILIAVFGVIVFIPLFVRLYHLQITDHDAYESKAIANQTRSTPLSASRGTIYDRSGNVLAVSTTVYNVFISPNELEAREQDVDRIAADLSVLLDVDADEIVQMAQQTESYYKIVCRRISQELADEVQNLIDFNDYHGIYLETDTQRTYPNNSLASNVLGFVGSEDTGLEGLESYYDTNLQGVAGRIVTTKGNQGTEMLYSYETSYTASDGDSLITTIDSTVQYYLEQNIEAAMEEYMVSKGAFGIFMDVNTGAVLGMASYNNFDPNSYASVFDEETEAELLAMKAQAEHLTGAAYEQAYEAYQQAVTDALLSQWRNRAVSDTYEPGSTFKVITLASALEEGAVTLNDIWSCNGSTEIKGRIDPLHCWDTAGHGEQSTAMALANSCNIAFANIGIQLGGEKLYDYVSSFGFLEPTGIDLPGESSSIFFSEDVLNDSSSYASLSSVAFGQTFKVTPLQLCRAISAVVNGGYLLQPYVVSEIIDSDGTSSYQAETTVLRQVISEQTSETMCDLLINVVENGTATGAQVTGFTIGGKTGTSEKIDEFDENGELVSDRIVSFVGIIFDENRDARYLCLIALDTPDSESGYYISGGVMGTATVRGVFSDVLSYLGIDADVTVNNANVTMPTVIGMTLQEAQEALDALNINVSAKGDSQLVTDQTPSGGSMIPTGSTAVLYMGEDKPVDPVTVPNVAGCSVEYAEELVNSSGLYLKILGSKSTGASVIATKQSIPAGTLVERGTVVEVTFTDTSSHD